MGRFGTSWENSGVKSMLRQGLMHRSKTASLFDHLVGEREQRRWDLGNPHGNRHRTRHLLNQEFMQALLLHFRQHGKKAIEKVARNQPAVYVKILALLVPREMQIEHTNRIKQMTDE